MTGLEKTRESLKKTYQILEDSLYGTTDNVCKTAYNGGIKLALMALEMDIEMVESRIEQEKDGLNKSR